ncbi:oligoribonuclease [Desulfogranum japonicum]|uniref:oligoribonuclease n=1 Tax=Desulfogranum japonicum TaxID=231447 RepID=UPI00048CB7D2|nr:oligoribonuclease [Desulfogranum japonicum]
MSKQQESNLVWLDLEMTGLDPDSDHILEVATVVTSSDLEVLATGPVLAIMQPDEILDAMDHWNQTHHHLSGLLKRVKDSSYDYHQAEMATLKFIQKWVPERASPMCGNSICQDRRFLAKFMPRLEAYFHYRNIDVSTIKELAARWAPDVRYGFIKKHSHCALEDIRESIEEMQYYRNHFIECTRKRCG